MKKIFEKIQEVEVFGSVIWVIEVCALLTLCIIEQIFIRFDFMPFPSNVTNWIDDAKAICNIYSPGILVFMLFLMIFSTALGFIFKDKLDELYVHCITIINASIYVILIVLTYILYNYTPAILFLTLIIAFVCSMYQNWKLL